MGVLLSLHLAHLNTVLLSVSWMNWGGALILWHLSFKSKRRPISFCGFKLLLRASLAKHVQIVVNRIYRAISNVPASLLLQHLNGQPSRSHVFVLKHSLLHSAEHWVTRL